MMSIHVSAILASIALSLLCASAHAQRNVTLYGVADIGFVRESGGPHDSRNTKLSSGVSAGSRLGFRGTEDLGGGYSAIFKLEMGLNTDTGTLGQGGRAFGRESWIGVSSGHGRLILGRQYTPVGFIQAETDPFNTGLAGTSANLISPGGAGGSNRMDNTVRYGIETEAGLTLDTAYAFGERSESTRPLREFGVAVGYVAGPAYVKLGHHNTNDSQGKAGKVTLLGAKYSFAHATAHFNYAVNKGSAVFGVVNKDSRDILIGISIPLNAGRLLASYIHKEDRTIAGHDANQWALGYVYNLSKQTALYSSIARIRNNAPLVAGGAFYKVGNASEAGSGGRAINFGMRHAF